MGTDIGETNVESDEDTPFIFQDRGEPGVRRPLQPLVPDRLHVMAGLPEKGGPVRVHVLVKLEAHPAQATSLGRGTTRSLASSEAYSSAACTSSTAT